MTNYMTPRQLIWWYVLSLAGVAAFVAWVFVPGATVSFPILGILLYGLASEVRISALENQVKRLSVR